MNTNTVQVVLLIIVILMPTVMMSVLMYLDGFRVIRLIGLVCTLTVGTVALLTVT